MFLRTEDLVQDMDTMMTVRPSSLAFNCSIPFISVHTTHWDYEMLMVNNYCLFVC